MSTYVPVIAGVLLCSLLTACGGGGDGNTTSPQRPTNVQSPDVILTGRFVDAPVEGLGYSTPTQNGTTSANGAFLYQAGETVTFRVGDVIIGQAPGAELVTPFSLTGAPAPLSLSETNHAVRAINLNRQAGNAQVTPLEIATNIALFLQTLDEDGDPANGIKLPAAVSGLTAGTGINFAQRMDAFRSDFAFRKLVAAGRGAGLWGGSRAIKQPLLALDALFAGVSLHPAVAAIGQIDQDTAGANLANPGVRTVYAYDVHGQRIGENIDIGTNNRNDLTITRRFDANGNLLTEQAIVGNSNVPAQTLTNVYDANGNLLSSTRDGSIAYSYDADGNLISVKAGGGGRHLTRYTYDPNGSLIFKEDLIGGSAVNLRTSYSYDVNGRLILVETDGAANFTGSPNGVADTRIRYGYDLNGRKILEETELAPGIVNVRIRYTYNASGDLLSTETDGLANGSGVADRSHVVLTTFTYDTDHRLLAQTQTTNGNLSRRITYGYDTSGNQISIETDSDGDNNVDLRETYTYDGAGTLSQYVKATGDTNIVLSRVRYSSSTPSSGTWGSAAWR